MQRPAKFTLGTIVLFVAAAGLWFIYSKTSKPAPAEQMASAAVTGSEVLDGMTFSSVLGPLGKAADVNDTLAFKDGNFVSMECEKKCNYPARPYFIRHVGDEIEFISETRCPHKDAKIVWRGTVSHGTIKGKFTWTISRFYWTVEKDFWFSGTLTRQAGPVAENQ